MQLVAAITALPIIVFPFIVINTESIQFNSVWYEIFPIWLCFCRFELWNEDVMCFYHNVLLMYFQL